MRRRANSRSERAGSRRWSNRSVRVTNAFNRNARTPKRRRSNSNPSSSNSRSSKTALIRSRARPGRGGEHAAIGRGQGSRTAHGAGADRTGFIRPPRNPRRESEGDVGPGTGAHRARGRTSSRGARARGPRTRTRIERAKSRSPFDRDVGTGDGADPARAGPRRPRDPARRDGPSVRVGGERETPGMGVSPNELAVPTGAIHHDIRISHFRTREENRRTRGTRPQPTGGARSARDGPIQTRRRSKGPGGQVGGSGSRVATIGGPARRA